MKFNIPEHELMKSGHVACPGCGASMAMRYALKALGPNTVVCIPACCWAIIDGPSPCSVNTVPVLHCAFETAAITATGVKAGLERQGKDDTTVMAWAGDGGTFDIGMQALSGAAERNEDIIYVCYDNEAYMNTGIQRSSATPWGAWTTTTPVENPKERPKKDIIDILLAHHIPYVATASVAYPDDFIRKMQKAKSIRGMKFIQILSPCPPGWKSIPEESVHISRLAINTKIFPVYEVENGYNYTINIEPKHTPVEEYLNLQGRFKHLNKAQVKEIQLATDRKWEILMKKVEIGKLFSEN